jgi:hypothetical protein
VELLGRLLMIGLLVRLLRRLGPVLVVLALLMFGPGLFIGVGRLLWFLAGG